MLFWEKKKRIEKKGPLFFGKMQQMEAEKIYHMYKQLFKVCLWHSEHSRALFFPKYYIIVLIAPKCMNLLPLKALCYKNMIAIIARFQKR